MSLLVNPDRPRVRRGLWGLLYPFPYSGLRRAWIHPTPPRYCRPPRYNRRQVVGSAVLKIWGRQGKSGRGQSEDTTKIRSDQLRSSKPGSGVGGGHPERKGRGPSGSL
ncbi:unnamed protein product [Rangifer tarandus platyrhynchus]|uniref:Uncharacterized protein n=2 Tax=Rangifer tarandus platyrhynchus TaxID=3082113 RepID=A0AC59ZKK8_RANTA|nr:unnamed protein product [Rangifer tarandus platyrhynchus]